MEKLQIALEKARKKRSSGVAAGQDATQRAKRMASADTMGADPWLSFGSFEPDTAHLVRSRIVAYDGGPEAAPFDMLRTKVLLQMRKHGWTRLAVTSPQEACGKTTAALNLALAFRRQTEKRVALFEMDMRRPSISQMLGKSPEYNVSQWLNGDVTIAEQGLRIGRNVFLSFNRRPSHDPAQILMSDRTSEMLDDFERLYSPDLMIFDLPPMLNADDTTAFLKNVDCALLVAGAERTTVSQVDVCETTIAEHSNVLGVVLNKCRFPDEETGYGYSNYY